MPFRVTKRPPPSKVKPIKAPKTLELTFDAGARQDYLTGFSKRKKARAQAARESAEAKEKEERVRERRAVSLRVFFPFFLFAFSSVVPGGGLIFGRILRLGEGWVE
jgi:ribosomal RNA-processing protein 17